MTSKWRQRMTHKQLPAAANHGQKLENADLEQSASSGTQTHRPQDQAARPRLVVVDGHDEAGATFQLAKSLSSKCPVFTNCGKAGQPKKPVKLAQKKLTRVPFQVSRLMEFCSRHELVNVTGHDVTEWPQVVLKELVDNSLDDAEEAEIAPIVSIVIEGTKIIVQDNGRGIPAKTIIGILDYTKRVSSREAYCSPARGAQGNALSSILPMGYVLDAHHKEEATSETIIEAHGVAHHIVFAVDHVRDEPKITHTTKPSTVVRGTRITIELPAYRHPYDGGDLVAANKDELLELAESYAWLNPHLSLRMSWNGEVKIDAKASNPSWKRWSPSWPTSAHWYDPGRLRRYMAAHIAHRGDITVRQFISELRGMSSTAKQKKILTETGASHRSLHEFFGLHKANTDNIAKLLASLKAHTKPVPPAELGIIGKAHLYARMEEAGGDPRTFKYERRLGETDGVPRVIEFAFGIHRDGLGAGRAPRRKEITGVNCSPAISNPFRRIGRSGEGLDAILMRVRANATEPVIVVLHLACPRVAYTDRGKTGIVVEGEVDDAEED
jgi:DNA topoisomerase VI subunit B